MTHPYSKEAGNPAELAAKAILETRGNTPRLYRNTLVFLAADKTRLQDLDEAARKYLAWESILAEQKNLNLSPFQVTQAETQRTAADSAVTARLPETYQWLLVPVQATPQAAITWEALRLSGTDALAVRASKKLRTDELYLTSFAPTRIKMELDRVPLWRGDHVAVKQLVEDFARYLYLPRLKDSTVLLHAISDGVSLLTWAQDSFGYADSFDETAGRYKGLRGGQMVALTDAHAPGLVVKPDVASRQMDAEQAAPPQVVCWANCLGMTPGKRLPRRAENSQVPPNQRQHSLNASTARQFSTRPVWAAMPAELPMKSSLTSPAWLVRR